MPSVAVVGAGRMAGVHAAACRSLGWKVATVSSRRPDRAAKLAADVGARPLTFAEQLDGPPPDLAIVDTPPADHARAAEAWAERGVPTVVATPLCTTLDDADRLVDASESVPIAFASSLPSAPVAQELFRRIAALGPLGHLSGRGIRPAPEWGGFLDGSWGGGVLLHPGTNHLTLSLLVARVAHAGRPTSVSASLGTAGPGTSDVDARVSIAFESGLDASIELAWRADVGRAWDLQLAGPSGVLRLDMDPAPALEQNGDRVPLLRPSVGTDGERALIETGVVPMLRTVWHDVSNGRRPVMDAAFGRDVLDIVAAAYTSAGADGTAVSLPFDGPRDRTPLELLTAGASR